MDRLGEFAGRIIRTGHESPELPVLDDHGAPAFFTSDFGLIALLFLAFDLLGISAFWIIRTS
jgi:hypothetical protein